MKYLQEAVLLLLTLNPSVLMLSCISLVDIFNQILFQVVRRVTIELVKSQSYENQLHSVFKYFCLLETRVATINLSIN